MPKTLRRPEAVREYLQRRYRNQCQNWLAGDGVWPLIVSLGNPTEREVADDPGSVREWVAAWSAWTGPAEIVWEKRQWPRLGAQRLPASVVIQTPAAVAAIIGEPVRWTTALDRYRRLTTRWPALAQGLVLTSKFSMLADYPAEDFERLFALLTWLETNSASNLYLRQLPVHGLDTKWVEQRIGVVTSLLRAILGTPEAGDFYDLCGIHKPPDRIRIRILCPELRRIIGGLCDIEGPVEELAKLAMAPAACLIVENLETGLAMPDMDGVVCIMKLGNAVSVLGQLPWLKNTRAVYWGDIDTHGFAILDRARKVLPQLKSILMDKATLLAHKALCGREPAQCPDIELLQLTHEEMLVYGGLRISTWGEQLRLEQERLPWDVALAILRTALSSRERTPG